MPKLLLESASALAGLALSTGTAVAVLLAPKVGTSEAPLAHFNDAGGEAGADFLIKCFVIRPPRIARAARIAIHVTILNFDPAFDCF